MLAMHTRLSVIIDSIIRTAAVERFMTLLAIKACSLGRHHDVVFGSQTE